MEMFCFGKNTITEYFYVNAGSYRKIGKHTKTKYTYRKIFGFEPLQLICWFRL